MQRNKQTYDAFLRGLTVDEAIKELCISPKVVRQLYASYSLDEALRKDDRFNLRVNQIKTIERELFESIALHRKNPKAETLNKINSLQTTYSIFLL